MGTKRVVPLVTSQQYTDPRAWHGPVGGFLVDQFWERYLEEKQLEGVADNIAERVLLYKCVQEVRPPSFSCPPPLPRCPPRPPQARPPFRTLLRRRAGSCRMMRGSASDPTSTTTSRR